jgi:hypothetical protein
MRTPHSLMARATEVFTPNDVPTVTYVKRATPLEQRLRDAFQTPKPVISISGPSKSGKTVLVNKVIDRDNLISIVGLDHQSGRRVVVTYAAVDGFAYEPR